MNAWLVVLLVFFWVAAGFGWLEAREAQKRGSLGWLRSGLILLFWPAFALYIAVCEVWSVLRDLAGTRD